MSDLKNLFISDSIAVVGASDDLSKRSSRPLRFLPAHGFGGKIYPINPKYDHIGGLKCYKTIIDVPNEIHTVMITIPKESVFEILEQCIQKQVKLVIIRAAGFAETGEEGKREQDKVREYATKGGFRVLGPSSLGYVNLHKSVTAYFHLSGEMKEFLVGNVGLISQSGGLSGAIFNMAQDLGIGFSYVISTGSEGDLESSELIEFLAGDMNTSVIVGFIEGVKDGRRFIKAADLAIKNRKPIILMKIGRSDSGRKAATSHTGSLTGSDAVFDSVTRQKGIIRVEDLTDLISTASVFSKCNLPAGNRVGIITSSGGTKAIVADKTGELEMNVPDLTEETKKRISSLLPEYSNISNPLDITGGLSENTFNKCLNDFVKDDNLDIIVVPITLIGSFSKERAMNLIKASTVVGKPIICLWIGGSLNEDGQKILEKSCVPVFRNAVNCIRAVKNLIEYKNFLEKMERPSFICSGSSIKIERRKEEMLRNIVGQSLTEYESKILLSEWGIPITKEKIVKSVEEALVAAREIGFPTVLKVMSPQILHKTEADIIRVGIKSEEELRKSYDEIIQNAKKYNPTSEIRGVLIQEMVTGGIETIVGVSQDPQFGPVIMFGLGGIFVEILKDTSLRVAPLTRNDAEEMIQEVKGFKLLRGFRGGPEYDVERIIDVLLKTSKLSIESCNLISEVDMNPLFVFQKGSGVKVVDSRVILKNRI
jgi:acyl-CoA synthetase (NDP forming)